MRKFFILLCLLFSMAVMGADEAASGIPVEVADLLLKGDFKKALGISTDKELKESLEKLLNLNKLVAESYKAEIGKEISLHIKRKMEKGTLTKIKRTTLYVKVDKGAVVATWPVKIKSLPIEFRMKRIAVSDFAKNLYFGVRAFRQKNYAAARFFLNNTGAVSAALLEAADKKSKYIMSLSTACLTGDLEKTKELLKKGADPNGKLIAHVKNKKNGKLEKRESTILIESVKNHKKEIIKYLVKNGADVNKANQKGVTPLMFAIMFFPKDMDIIEFLLNHQAKFTKKDKAGNTALTGAVGAGRLDAVKLLIKHGVDVNTANRKGITPLMIAAFTNNISMFKLLMEKGADMNKKHPKGWTIFQLDRTRMHPEIRAILDAILPVKKRAASGFPGFSTGGTSVVPRRR